MSMIIKPLWALMHVGAKYPYAPDGQIYRTRKGLAIFNK